MDHKAPHRVFLSAVDLASGGHIARLSHPRTSQPISVAIASGRLLEVNKFQEPAADEPRSWLLAGAERVQQEGALFLATPFDPLFLLLSPLRKLRGGLVSERRESSAGVFRPLSDLSGEAGDADAAAALEATALALPDMLTRLRAVCDVNDKYDEPMVRLNDAKVAAWLRRKVAALRAHLASDASLARLAASKAADAHTTQFDALDIPVNGGCRKPTDDHLAMAVALVADYLDAATQASLCAACDVEEAAVEAQRGTEKRAVPHPPLAAFESTSSAGSSFATDLADADAEVSVVHIKRESAAAPPPSAEPLAKKPKPAAPSKSKVAAPLKKGQTTMMGFFKK